MKNQIKDLQIEGIAISNDFLKIDNDKLLLSESFKKYLFSRGIFTARALWAALRAFPNSFEGYLDNPLAFEERLEIELRQVLPAEVFDREHSQIPEVDD